ncbi:MAG: ABC transporter ATP-binding protein [Clostridia bacterium]|nr:ABC transporter ATP-binding protein [Clostridia bacterium]
MFKKLAKSLREYKAPAILTIFLMIGEAVVESLIPYITANYLINEIQKNGENVEMTAILKVGLILVLMAMLSLSFGGAAGFTSAKAAAGFSKNLRHDLFSRVQTFTFRNIDKFSSASLVTRLTTDVNYVQMSFMMLIRIAIRSPLMLAFSVIMAARLGGMLSLTFAVVIPVLAFGLILIAKKAMPAFHRVFKKYDRLNESVEENVRGMRVVKGFSREEYEKKRFGKAADDICEDFTKAERIVAVNNPLMNFCMYFNMAAVLLLGSYLAIGRPESGVMIGQMSAIITYGVQVLMSLMMLSMIYVTLTISAESARRICEVLDETPDMEVPKDPVKEVKDGSILFRNVNFKYAKEAEINTLSDVNLKIDSGMTVGILGGTGAGKSSLVQLIPRLYDVTEGSLSVGGVDVRDYDLDTLRNQVAMVLQKNLLFAGTIRDNLRWGNPDATDEELEEACRLAQADEFIQTFPEGYDTYIEQGGTNVSGGQKQRLCIARALLKKPKILILDDSTSAVDTHTDALIRAGFKSYLPNTTKIIIAQRVSSVQDADLILVMDNGKIVATGDHNTLLASNEIYKEIYEQQTKGGDEDAENA